MVLTGVVGPAALTPTHTSLNTMPICCVTINSFCTRLINSFDMVTYFKFIILVEESVRLMLDLNASDSVRLYYNTHNETFCFVQLCGGIQKPQLYRRNHGP